MTSVGLPATCATVGADHAKVAIAAVDGCMVSAVAGIEDALAIGSMHGGRWLECAVVSQNGQPITGFGGRWIDVHGSISDSARLDVIVVPPVLGDIAGAMESHRELVAWLNERHRHGTVLASVCTGAFFLAEAGLLDGRAATTNPAMAALFSARYPAVQLDTARRLIDQRDVICAGTTTAFLDLAIRIVERFADHGVAVQTAKTLCMDLNRGSQQPYFLFAHPSAHDDADILSLQRWMEREHASDISLSSLAKRAAMSTRSLSRRFRNATGYAPLDYLHRLRVEAAKRMLESGKDNVAEITLAVGYEDARSFSRLFRRISGVTPREYRQRFG